MCGHCLGCAGMAIREALADVDPEGENEQSQIGQWCWRYKGRVQGGEGVIGCTAIRSGGKSVSARWATRQGGKRSRATEAIGQGGKAIIARGTSCQVFITAGAACFLFLLASCLSLACVHLDFRFRHGVQTWGPGAGRGRGIERQT
jgi:hypothetical protein